MNRYICFFLDDGQYYYFRVMCITFYANNNEVGVFLSY